MVLSHTGAVSMRRPGSAGVVCVLLLTLAACGGSDSLATSEPSSATSGESESSTTGPESSTTPASEGERAALVPAPAAHPMPGSDRIASVSARWEKVPANIPNATGLVWNEREDAYYGIGQEGLVYRVDEGLQDTEVVLDLTAEVTPLASGSERGLLGIDFDPRDGRLFLYFTDPGDDTRVTSWAMVDGVPDSASRREVLFQEQPGLGHKAGQLVFDDDGNLFIGLGDGGGSNGRDAQDMSKMLGAILRITPKLGAEGYTVPDDNPFVGQGGVRPEIYAKGLRNPWRFSLDRATGDLWIGDVGDTTMEEIDHLPAGTSGQNFGWYFFEGSLTNSRGGTDDMVGPVAEYRHDEVGPAVIAGFVYHGAALPNLRGAFVYGDMSGPVFGLGTDGPVRLGLERIGGAVSTFAQTPQYELLALSQREGVYRLVPA